MSIIRGSGSNMFFRIAVLGSWGFHNIGGTAPVLESLFNKVAGLKACNFLAERLWRGCFPWRTDSTKERTELSNCYHKNDQKKGDHEKLLKIISGYTKSILEAKNNYILKKTTKLEDRKTAQKHIGLF